MAPRHWCALAAFALALAACASEPKHYQSFIDVPYGYDGEATYWSSHAGLHVRAAVLNPEASETIVLLHPWMTNMLIWRDVAPALAKTRRVVLIDLPGHGKSGKPFGAYPVSRHAWAVLDVLDALGVHDPVIAGNSLGGATAIEIARIAPKKVAAVILIASPGGQEISSPIRGFVRSGAGARELSSLNDGSYYLGWLVVTRRMSSLAERLYEDLLALRDSPEFAHWAASTSSSLAQVVEYKPPLEQIAVPALVLHGSEDLVVPLESGQAIAARMPRAELVQLYACGHVPELECPELLVSKMNEWLNRAPYKDSSSPEKYSHTR